VPLDFHPGHEPGRATRHGRTQTQLRGRLSDDESRLVRFQVSTAVTMKNSVFWNVTPCGSCKSRRFGGACRLHLQGREIHGRRKMLTVAWQTETKFEKSTKHKAGVKIGLVGMNEEWGFVSLSPPRLSQRRALSDWACGSKLVYHVRLLA
jgi:hypothetical protein